MKAVVMTPQEALDQGKRFPYALVRTLSQVTLGPTGDVGETRDLLEVRFFSDSSEIRIYRQDGDLRAVRLQDDGTIYVDREYSVSNKKFGKRITVRFYMDFDEDGQAYWSGDRLVDWEEAEGNG